MRDATEGPLGRLWGDGLLRREAGRARTTDRWQSAMARAAFRLMREGDDCEDLRVPIAVAVVGFYGALPDAELAEIVEAMLPIETAELAPFTSGARSMR